MMMAMSSGSSSTGLSSTRRVAVTLSPKRGSMFHNLPATYAVRSYHTVTHWCCRCFTELGMEIEADGRRVKVQGFYTDNGERMPAEASGKVTYSILLFIHYSFIY